MTVTVHPTRRTAYPVHDDHLARWCPAFEDGPLRDAVIHEPRFADRITDMLIAQTRDGEGALDDDFADQALLDHVVALNETEDLTQIGQMWMAPCLVQHLVKSDARTLYGVTERARFEAIFSLRDHISSHLLPALTPEFDFSEQGRACLRGWMAELPKGVRARLTLALPKENERVPDHCAERAAVFREAMTRMHAGDTEKARP